MKITVWGINYAPECTGIGPYNTALCEYLAERGHQVGMITTFSHYPAWRKNPGDRQTLFRSETRNRVAVHRCWHYVPCQVNTWKRIAHEATFVAVSFLRQLALPRPDVRIVVSPPLLLGAAAWLLALLKPAPFIFHVQDLQPDAAAGLGMVQSSAFIRWLYRLERFAYRKAARVSAISRAMLEAIQQKGVADAKLVFFPNPVLVPALESPAVPGAFRRRHGLAQDDLVAVYSGNLGVKQGLDVLIEAARLSRNPRVRYVICGDGTRREHLAERIRQKPLPNLLLLPLQPADRYYEMLLDADLGLVTQRSGAGRCFFPSKLLPLLALGKPVVAVADQDSEMVGELTRHGFGFHADPGQPQQLADLLDRLAEDRSSLEAVADAGQRFVAQFDPRRILEQFEVMLLEVAKSP